MTRICEITDPNELDSLRPSWSKLLEQTPGADFFRTLQWFEVYWRHFGEGQRLRVLVVGADDQPTGILPLVVRPQRTRLGTFQVLTYPLDDWGSFYGPIGPDPAATLRAGLQYISRQSRDWDYVDLRWMREPDRRHDWIAAAMHSAAMRPSRRASSEIPLIELNSSWDEYWVSRSNNWRSNCRRNEKKLVRHDRVEHVRYRPRGKNHGECDLRWDLYDQCEQIAHSSWQARSTNGTTITHPSIRDFLKEMHSAAVQTGCLDLNLLLVDGRAAAFNYGYHYRGHVSSLRLGFDSAFGRCGVGTVLTWRMLKDSFERGDRLFDFLPGSLDVKRNWQTTAARSCRYEFLPFQPGRVELLRAKHWLENRVGRFFASRPTESSNLLSTVTPSNAE